MTAEKQKRSEWWWLPVYGGAFAFAALMLHDAVGLPFGKATSLLGAGVIAVALGVRLARAMQREEAEAKADAHPLLGAGIVAALLLVMALCNR